MPWKVQPDHPDCPSSKPFGVVNTQTGRKVACHATAASARRQVAALYVNVPESQQAASLPDKVSQTREGSMLNERRYTPLQVEYRDGDGQVPTIGGYAAVWEKPSKNLGGFVETVRPTFANRSAGQGWPGIFARFNHDDNKLLGTTDAGTLQLRIDDTGLGYRVQPPKSRADVVELVQRGDVRYSSFAFYVVEDDWGVTDEDYPQRTLISGDIVDVAPVVNPAYDQTTVQMERETTLQAASLSLSRHKDVPPEEAREMLVENRAISLFRRTDGPAPHQPVLGQKAVMDMMGKRDDPLAS